MNKKVVSIAVIVLLVAGIAAWALVGKNDSQTNSSENNETTPLDQQTGTSDAQSEAGQEASQEAVITFTNDGFSPKSLTVKAGTVVTVKNESSTNVQFSSDDHPSHRLNTEMNLRVLGPGERATFTATTVGTHGYHDHIQDEYTGTLVVN